MGIDRGASVAQMAGMDALPLRFETPVTLVGGGALDRAALDEARRHAPVLIAADAGADRLAEFRLAPRAVIGDMDSITDPGRWRDGPAAFLHLAEQETTDFEKCLYATEAPLYLAVGFTGRRTDHTLAVFHAMLRHAHKRVVVIGTDEVAALAPAGRRLRLALTPGVRVSVHPLLPVQASYSRGLAWPLAGEELAPGRRIGTSNEATAPVVEMTFVGPGALVLLERTALATLIAALSNPAR